MGCWNETCAISNIAIRWGDPVVGLFVVKRGHDKASGHCYSDSIWAPAFLPIRGTYDDYGRIENTETTDNYWNNSHILRYIQDNAVPMEEGSNSCHEPAVVPSEIKDLMQVQDLIRDNRIWLRDKYSEKELLLGIVLVHEHIWNTLQNRTYVTWADETVNKEILAERSIKTINFLNPSVGFLLGGQLEVLRLIGNHPSQQFMSYVDQYTNEFIIDFVVPEIASLAMVCEGMENLRKHWVPQSGKGSQDDDRETMRLLMKGVEEVFTERDKEEY